MFRPIARATYPGKPSPFVIDAHAHFFNATDVNVRGYLEKCIAHAFEPSELRPLVAHAGIVADALADEFATRADVEFQDLLKRIRDTPADEIATYRTRPGGDPLDAEVRAHRQKLSELIARRLPDRNQPTDYRTLKVKHRGDILRSLGRAPTPSLLEEKRDLAEMIQEDLDPESRQRALDSLGLDKAKKASHGPGSIVAFVGYMLSPRWMLLHDYARWYTEREGAFGVDAVLGALVDFDRWLDCYSTSARRDQMMLQSLLSLMSGGFMLPLISYNPWTDIADGGASLALVQEAIQHWGFVGVKIYPPVGYYPYGNGGPQALPYGSSLRRPDANKLDQALAAMFRWCAENGVPVMAHSGETMGRDDFSDELGGPDGWKRVATLFEGDGPGHLVVNAGHLGGAHKKPPPSDTPTWPEAILGASTPRATFYGDLGFWDELRDCGPAAPNCEALVRLRPALALPGARKRVMFGTDWFMLSQEPWWPDFPGLLADRVDGLIPPEDLFYRNAIACYGLGQGGAQRARVLDRLAKSTAGEPAWLSAAA